MNIKRFFKDTLITGLLVFALLGAGVFAFVVYTFKTMPTPEPWDTVQHQQATISKAEEWAAFCTEYDCEEIPEGHIVKEIGGDTLSLIHRTQPRRKEGCWLTSDSYDETEYVDGKVRRGAALGHIAQPYKVLCGEKSSPFTRWEDFAIIYGGRLIEGEPSRNNVYLELLGPSYFYETDPKPSYASRQPLLLPATAEFDLFDPDLQKSGARIYLSKARMFQGRHVILLCNDRCEMQTISFAEDEGLKTLHVQELIQFSWYGSKWQSANCKVFQPLWDCGPPMEDHLAAMARYVRFLDQAVDAARRPPLPKLN